MLSVPSDGLTNWWPGVNEERKPFLGKKHPQAKESEGAAQQSSAGISLPLLPTAANSVLGNKAKVSQA